MSGASTTGFRRELLAQRFLGTAPGYSSFAVALTRRVPTTNSSANQLDEPVGMAYARASLAIDAASWEMLNDNVVAIKVAVYFPTATGLWGTIGGWALLSSPGGVVKAVGTLNEPYRVGAGVRPYLAARDLSFGLFD